MFSLKNKRIFALLIFLDLQLSIIIICVKFCKATTCVCVCVRRVAARELSFDFSIYALFVSISVYLSSKDA